jgi:hypothetical protein
MVLEPSCQFLPEGKGLLLVFFIGPEAVVELVVIVLAISRPGKAEHRQFNFNPIPLGNIQRIF